MKEKEKQVSENGNKVVWKGPKLGIVIVVGVLLIILLGMQVFASTNGYGNVFFMIKELVTTGSLQGESEIFLDKEITLSYKSIDVAEGVKMQVNRLEIKENESTLCLHITADEKNTVLPLTYEWMSEGLKKTKVDVEFENARNTAGDFDERLTVKYTFSDDELMTLFVKDKDGKLLRELEINLGTHEIYVKGESEVEKISQIELKKYLSTFSRLNNDSEKRNQLVQIAYDIHEIAAPGIQDAPEISKMNEAIKEFYGDKVEFVKEKSKSGKELEIFKVDGQKAKVSDKMDIYENFEDLDNTKKGICLKIEDIKFEDGIYTVKYIYTLVTEMQEADNKIEELPQYEATIKLKRNENAKYSKYQVVELSKGTEVKEKVSTDVKDDLTADDMKVTKERVAGDYVYYEAKDKNGNDVEYREIFGSSFSMNAGKMTLNKDGSFEAYLPGVTDKVYATDGTFEIDGNNIILNYSDSRKETLEYINAQDSDYVRIKQKYSDYTLILKLKAESSNSFSNCEHDYQVVRNSGTKGPDGTHTTLDGTHIARCTICGEEKQEPHNFGKWFELKNSAGEIYAYTLWCNDCKDYIYTSDYSVVQNSGYEMNETKEVNKNKEQKTTLTLINELWKAGNKYEIYYTDPNGNYKTSKATCEIDEKIYFDVFGESGEYTIIFMKDITDDTEYTLSRSKTLIEDGKPVKQVFKDVQFYLIDSGFIAGNNYDVYYFDPDGNYKNIKYGCAENGNIVLTLDGKSGVYKIGVILVNDSNEQMNNTVKQFEIDDFGNAR